VVADTANADPLTRRVYESYVRTRRLGRDWANISEAPYYQKRELVLGR
jgi:TRAP-type mannitol/chloroaromatic compound transport system substrate-binding protein